MRIETIDAHAEGGPLRLVVQGFPAPRGSTMLDKLQWAEQHADHLRRAIMLEPRGHLDMHGGVLTEPVAPGSHAGVLFMHSGGYRTMSGHGVIAAATIALERRLLVPGGAAGDQTIIVFDTPAGTVRVRAAWVEGRVSRVAFQNVPSFVVHGGVGVNVNGRQLRADIAFGGAFYAIVDSEAAGVGVDRRYTGELRVAGMRIRTALESVYTMVHPADSRIKGLSGTIFTGPAGAGGADLRNATVFANGAVERSPSGTGTAAVMAVLDAMGLIGEDAAFVHEGLAGTRMRGRITGRTTVGAYDAIVPELSGSAWITGEHAFVVDPGDPLADGFI